MQPLLVRDICKLLQGKLFSGSDQWYVKNAVVNNRHDVTGTHYLVFVYRRDEVHWAELDRKAPCVVITDKPKDQLEKAGKNTTIIIVKSVVQAYWKFVNYYRGLFNIPVVAITGTCGKSTTKEMIKQMMSVDRKVQATESSKNEPRRSFPYLMGIDHQTKAAVFETGLGNPGNIKHQCLIYQPTIGIITTIGAHHLDGCKTIDGYIQAKGEIVEGLKYRGTLILNVDDENIKKISLASYKGKIIYFGKGNSSDFQAKNIHYVKDGMKFDIRHKNKIYTAFVPGYGEHQVYNALAAIAAVNEMGLSIEEAINRLHSFKNMQRHLEISSGINGSTIIDDTWTINPTSIEAALNVMDHISEGKKKIVLLGNINRLGNYEKRFHQEIGSLIAGKDIHTLITIGNKAVEIARQAKRDQFKGNVQIFEKVDGIKELLMKELDENTHLLIKGPMSSRSMIQLASDLKL
ncbi:UDP-N-acetylmuramoyl-tripeptide--D-alanyl-D-alanine ligase [Bacillus sp. 31A1R]|uniref:UDP-N-acetylmuramoyl-tripeptide--D-alanyl-D-alanine ligase n=1 Tax=Robertmurraya mangrovi TaxID=3098077 RepID=A0ABU5J0T6_9BACI|nr:UDP-N-acetylmuramoyl-tripeptide--D-alanyl-D-alanine ligase [Bacillus sp. 31A1R]MDZ5472991.1 UDP-N-acetylmuramoyl-tripeptide--D-alanyl-D-alanine ligase [Bacillus sp. 31A1R]